MGLQPHKEPTHETIDELSATFEVLIADHGLKGFVATLPAFGFIEITAPNRDAAVKAARARIVEEMKPA